MQNVICYSCKRSLVYCGSFSTCSTLAQVICAEHELKRYYAFFTIANAYFCLVSFLTYTLCDFFVCKILFNDLSICTRSNSLRSHERYLRILLIFSISHIPSFQNAMILHYHINIRVPFYCLILIIPSKPILGYNKHSILNFYSIYSNVKIFVWREENSDTVIHCIVHTFIFFIPV